MESDEPARKKRRSGEPAEEIRTSYFSLPGEGRDVACVAFNWLCSYNKRCPLVRFLKTPNVTEEYMVKFFYKDLEKDEFAFEEFTLTDYSWPVASVAHKTIDELINSINKFTQKAGIMKFSLVDTKEKPFWAKLLTLLDEIDLKIPKERRRDGPAGLTWASELYVLRRKQYPDQMRLILHLVNALAMDFTKGHAKKFLSVLIEEMLKSIHGKTLEVSIPEMNYGATTRVEHCYSKGQFNADFPPDCTEPKSAPPSPAERSASVFPMLRPRSMSHSSSVESVHVGQRRVPDCEVYLEEWPGKFPLIIEANGSLDSVDKEDEQNLHQMFSKFCFQDIIFSLRISALEFSIHVMIKDSDASNSDRNISLLKSIDIPLFKQAGVSLSFLPQNLNLMFSFVYSLLDWCSKTGCILHKPKPKA